MGAGRAERRGGILDGGVKDLFSADSLNFADHRESSQDPEEVAKSIHRLLTQGMPGFKKGMFIRQWHLGTAHFNFQADCDRMCTVLYGKI